MYNIKKDLDGEDNLFLTTDFFLYVWNIFKTKEKKFINF